MLVRLFARRLEIRELKTQALLRTHDRAEKPGTVVLLMNERVVFNPSRETQRILSQAKAIGVATHKLCETLFEREGRGGPAQALGHRRVGTALPAPIDQQCLRNGDDRGRVQLQPCQDLD